MITVRVNGTATSVDAGISLASILAEHGVPERGVAVAVDDEVVPRAVWGSLALADGARIEVLTAVQGG